MVHNKVYWKSEKSTRGSNSALTLLLNRTEFGKRASAFQGAKMFNKLPKEAREGGSRVLFKHKLKSIQRLMLSMIEKSILCQFLFTF